MLYLSSTQLTAFSECPRKWYYNYHLRRTKASSSAMNRGSCYHRVFDLFYKDGLSIEDIFTTISTENPEYIEHLPECISAFIGHQKAHPKLEFVMIDGKPAIEQDFTLQLEDDVIVRGRIDYIHQMGSKRYITDIKCTGMYLSDYYFGQFELCFQSMLYSYVGKKFFEGIEGFMIDAVMMRKNSPVKYDRCFYPLLPNLEEFIDEIYRTAHFIKTHLPLGEDAFEHRWTSCSNKYGKCQYFDVCKSSKAVRDRLLALDTYVDYSSIYKEGDDEE